MAMKIRVRLCFSLMMSILGLSFCMVATAFAQVDGAPPSILTAMSRGTTQLVLAACLLAVTGALCITAKELIHAYRERISALERAAEQAAIKAAAETNLANAINSLKQHCADMAARRGG